MGGGGDWGMGWGAQSKQDSIETILEALELGVNWIDTAHAYGFGEAEEVIAEALSQWQDKVFLATKCEFYPNTIVFLRDLFPLRLFEKKLKDPRLRVETDLYQIHWPSPIENLEESWQTLLELRSEGKVANIGVCNCYMDELKILGDPSYL